MEMRPLGGTGLKIAPLVFGGNVFGWTADQKTSFALLDRFVDAGFNAIDTADAYSRWVPGHQGGESETVIGAWLKANPAKRQKVLILTKVGSDMGKGKGLREKWILEAVEDSLKRLQIDVIDLYQSHWPDDTPYEETLGAYAKLLKAGKIRAIGASNLDAKQLGDSLAVSKAKGLPRYESLQPVYNLHDRAKFEGPLAELCIREKIGVISYFGLASGFLTGKYRSEADLGKSPRGQGVKKYLDARGFRVLAALDAVSAKIGATQAEIALAWLIGRPGLTAPIASATSLPQLEGLIRAATLKLSAEDAKALTEASAY
jgi:aryl-alcohol dehydrogenase-like predicted oxidoreductase